MNVTGTRKYPIIAYYTDTHTPICSEKRSKTGSNELINIIRAYLPAQDSFYIRLISRSSEAAVEFSWAQTFCTVPHRSSETWADDPTSKNADAGL